MKTTWKAKINKRFDTATQKDFQLMLGSVLPTDKEYFQPELTRAIFKNQSKNILL